MIFWHSTTFNNLINAKGEQILMKKKLCLNVANKILGKVRKFQDHIITLQELFKNLQVVGPFDLPQSK